MSLYILKVNEEKLLALSFEEIFAVLRESPKAMLNSDCETLNLIEAQDFGFVDESWNGTLYQRFRRVVDKDEEGRDIQLSYLIDKFQAEFDS